MMTRKWLLTTMLCGGLALGGFAGTAMAQSGKLLQPNSNWAVSRLAAAQTGGQPYCALARRFNGDMIVTLARNGQDEGSIAIDFQKTALNNTQHYFVTLRPGFSQDRSFNIRPVSGKALVIRLGQDYAFYDALDRSGELDVDISGENYKFNFADFSEGQKKLSECLAGIIEPAAGGPDSPIPMPGEAPRSSSFHRIADTQDTADDAPLPIPAPAAPVPAVSMSPGDSAQIQSLQEENMRLRGALERERRNYEERYLQENQSSSVAAELNERVRLLEMENKDLRAQTAYTPPPEAPSCPAPDDKVRAELERQLSQVRDENARLQQQAGDADAGVEAELARLRDENSQLRAQSAEGAGAESALAALKDENLSLKQDIAAQQAKNALLEKQLAENGAASSEAETAVMDSLRQRVAKLESENAALKADKTAAAKGGSDVPVSLAQLRSVEEQLRLVQQDRDKLLKQIDAANQGKADSLLDISSDNWNLEQATRRFNEAEREIQRLARQLEETRTTCAVEKKQLEYMLFDPDVAEKEQISKLMDLETKVNQAQAVLDEQKTGYEEKLAALQSDLSSAKLSSAQGGDYEAVKQERDELAQQKTALEQDKTKLGGQIASLQAQLSAAEQDLGNARIASVSQAPAPDYTVTRQERDELALQKAALEEDNERLNGRIAALESQLAGIQTAAGEQEVSSEDTARIAALTRRVDELMHERNVLEQERNRLSEEQHSMGQKVAALETTLASIPTGAGEPADRGISRPAPVEAEPVVPKAVGAAQSAAQSYESEYRDFGQAAHSAVAAAPVIPVAVASSGPAMSPAALQSTLQQAGIAPQGGIRQAQGAGQGITAYSWDTGVLYGSAEQQPMASAAQFDDMVGRYLEKTRSRCKGEFGALPVMTEQAGSLHVSSYEIACIGNEGSASAAIVFYSEGGVFTTIAHETAVESMDAAMDARDSLVTMLMQTQIASR